MKIIERIHNAETNEIIDLERDETPTEKAQREALEAEHTASIAAQEAATAAKLAAKSKLEALGLTSEDLKALGL